MMKPAYGDISATRVRHRILLGMHLMTLAAAVLLIGVISYDAIVNVSFLSNVRYLRLQFWICLLFIADLIVEMAFARNRTKSFFVNLPFLLICIPYISIFKALDIHLGDEATFVLRFVALIRAAAVFAIITGAITRNRIRSVFHGYIILLVTLVYFASLMFFVEEHAVNPYLQSYGKSLWWTIMNMTTTGSNIPEITGVGKALAVMLSGAGLILFPICTVYITDMVVSRSRSGKTRADTASQ